MKDSKDYFVANIVTKEEMQCKGYMDFILRRMKERISNGILDIVSDGNEYAIRMLPEQRIERPDIMTVEVRNGISVKELVRCKDCLHHTEVQPYDEEDELIPSNAVFCQHFEVIRDKNWFCADGERKTDEQQ